MNHNSSDNLRKIIDICTKLYGEHCVKETEAGIIAIMPQMFTWGIGYNLDEHGMSGRFCFADRLACVDAFHDATLISDTHPPEELGFVKHKGTVDYSVEDLVAVYKTGKIEYVDDEQFAPKVDMCNAVIANASTALLINLKARAHPGG